MGGCVSSLRMPPVGNGSMRPCAAGEGAASTQRLSDDYSM